MSLEITRSDNYHTAQRPTECLIEIIIIIIIILAAATCHASFENRSLFSFPPIVLLTQSLVSLFKELIPNSKHGVYTHGGV